MIWRSFVLIIITSLLAGCSWQESRRPSILLIAVEGLSFDRAACNVANNESTDGLEQFCSESVRFTHAYTPSLMSQATLASIFSARFPSEHGVWHNGPQHLSERIETVAEVALARGYRTSFFSGGAPIWRKSGIEQGFEWFDDNIPVGLRNFYRPALQNFNLFLRWLDRETSKEPFFSAIYLADLQFPGVQTENDLGEVRSLSVESQIREVSESLGYLIDQLKKRNRWNNTYVVVTGLNGHVYENHSDEITPLDLHGMNTQVFLAVKPATKARDEAIEWSIDSNVTLVDLGATFYDLLGASEGAFLNREYATHSLVSVLERPVVTWSKDRFIVMESAWAHWRGVGTTRYGLRQEHFFFIHDLQPKLFNTLIDKQEVTPLSTKDPLTRSWFQRFSQYFEQKNIGPYSGIPDVSVEKIKIAQELAEKGPNEPIENRMEEFVRMRPWEKQVLGWLARSYIKREKWQQLEDLGTESLNPLWVYVARARKGLSPEPPRHECFDLLFDNSDRSTSECGDTLFLSFVNWVRSPSRSKSSAEEKFLRQWVLFQIDEQVSRLNYQNGLMWDTALDLPGEPTLVELAIQLPAFQRYAVSIENIRRRAGLSGW